MNDYHNTRNFYLTGIKHSGKSQLGYGATSFLAKQAEASFVDIDALVLKQISPRFNSIRDFYRSEGKDIFMLAEFEALEAFLETIDSSPPGKGLRFQIIATGGGACDNLRLLDLMHRTGIIVYLQVHENALFHRILLDGLPPFLEGPDPREVFHRLYEERNAKYSNIADFMIQLSDSNTIEENSAFLAGRLLQFVS
jgi:shikimate kinase